MSTIQIACPHCVTRNRVPADRLDDDPKCGSCKQALMPAVNYRDVP